MNALAGAVLTFRHGPCSFAPSHLEMGESRWNAAVGSYRLECVSSSSSTSTTILSVVENGTPIEQHDVPHPESSDEVRELAERLRLEHMSRAVVVAQRLWRGGSTACLTARHD